MFSRTFEQVELLFVSVTIKDNITNILKTHQLFVAKLKKIIGLYLQMTKHEF